MSARKTPILTLILYLFIYLLPATFNHWWHLGAQTYLVTTIDYIIGAGLLYAIYRQDAPLTFEKKHLSWSNVLFWSVIGAAAAFIGQTVARLIEIVVFHSDTSSANTNLILTVIKSQPYFLIASIIAAPIMEELVFRRILFGYLQRFTGVVGAALIASVLFAAAHADGHLLTYTAISLVFCYIYHRTGKIAASMGSHMLMNAVVILVALH